MGPSASSFFLATALLAGAVGATPSCTPVTFTVSGTAQNHNLTGPDILSNLPAILQNLQSLGTVTVSGSQTLAGVYCNPEVKNANNKKLQLLSHGITSGKIYWDAQGGSQGYPPYQPGNYSWVDYASAQGFPTLAIDRLGCGESSHPDPVLVVQGPYEYALYHDLTQQIKAGSTGALPCAFNDVIYVGHSYGSEIGASMAQLYPGDFESIVLTGFSKLVLPSLLGVSLQLPVPAAVHDPSRFADLALGYVTSSYESGKTNSFFGTRAGIDYDPENAHLFYTREDVVSLGQFVTTYSGNSPAPAYKGRILVLTGGKDQAFCGPGSPVLGPADCATLVPGTQTLFPNAEYNYRIIPNTGHSVNLHFNGHSAFVTAHQFLAGQRFSN